jgi:transposase
MKAYSFDLRTKIVQSVRRSGISISETARRFGVNRSTIGRYLKRLDEDGSLAPKKAPGSPSKLDESAMRLLEKDIKNRPWATHGQRKQFLFAICGVEVSETTICRAIKKRLSHSRKKERQEPLRRHSRRARICGGSLNGSPPRRGARRTPAPVAANVPPA